MNDVVKAPRRFSPAEFASCRRLLTLPEVAVRLVEVAQQSEPDYAEVSRIVRSDPAICARILKTANSALFAFRHRVETIEDALPKLGLTTLRTLILSFHLARYDLDQLELRPIVREYWRSSLTQATMAELIAERMPGADPPTYFLAGMLQDIGILAMLSEAPQEYAQHVLEHARFPDVVTAERNYFGFSHIEVSQMMLTNWGLNEAFCQAISSHHDQVIPADESGTHRMRVAMSAASQGAEMLLAYRDIPTAQSVPPWAELLQTRLGVNESQATDIIDQLSKRVSEYSAVFSFDIGSRVCPERVIAEAKELLQEIALRNQLELARRASSHHAPENEADFYLDCVSGLFNRRYLNDRLSDRFQGSIDKREAVALLFIDIDQFKQINDRYGHAAGDRAIRHVADWLKQSLRKTDVAIRLGGDEFLVMLHGVGENVFDRIAARIANEIPPLILEDQTRLKVSLSVGCVYWAGDINPFPELNRLIDKADQAMYRAKRQGGARCSR